RSADAREQRIAGSVCRRSRVVRLDERETAFGQRRQRLRDRIEALDADGLQVRAENGFDGALPATLHDEPFGQASALVELLRLEPRVDLLGRFAERRFLQGFE